MARDARTAVLLAGALLVVYHANGGLLIAPDSIANMIPACSLVRDGDMTFDPREAPVLFRWSLHARDQEQDLLITRVDERAAKLIDAGELRCDGPRYLAVPTTRPNRYVSTFPPGVAWLTTPFFAVASLFVGDLCDHPAAMWYLSKALAAASVAASAGFLYLALRTLLNRLSALFLAVAYALGTSVWTTSSQGLWQHGPVELLLAISLWLICDGRGSARHAETLAVLLGAATICRPTIALFVIAVGIHLLRTDRSAALRYVVAGLPLALFLAAYNQASFGSPFRTGEALVLDHALEKTGGTSIFPTPLTVGLATSLFSPSRGLFIYSPFLLAALPGAIRVFRRPELAHLRPIPWGIAAIWFIQSIYFDYWGGWSFGNRNLVDTVPMLIVLVGIAVASQRFSLVVRALFFASVVWSVAWQSLGAWSYDLAGWNGRVIYEVSAPDGATPRVTMSRAEADEWARETGSTVVEHSQNVDLPENHHRLWSWTDSQMIHTLQHPADGYRGRIAFAEMFARPASVDQAANDARIADAFVRLGEPKRAIEFYRRAIDGDPANTELHHKLREIVSDP